MTNSGRGGKRENSGRKVKEKTTVVRIPVSLLEVVKNMIANHTVNGTSRKPRAIITNDLKLAVWNEYKAGNKQLTIATRYNISVPTVSNIVKEFKTKTD